MNLKLNGSILLVGCALGVFIGSKVSLPGLQTPVASSANPPPKKEERKIERSFDQNTGKLVKESVVENISTPSLNPKPRYKITALALWDRENSKPYYAGMYEKPYSLPLLGDVDLGIYVDSKVNGGLSLKKEFY